MITYFTTAKDFRGRAAIQQTNAILSWKASVEHAEVVVFGDCLGADEARDRLGFVHIPDVERSDQGTPFIRDMFDRISRSASHAVCCYVNADILVTRRFARSLVAIHDSLRTGYLVAGQRRDVDLEEEIRFGPGWEAELEALCADAGRLHPPSGSDYFAFPKGQFRKEDIPGLLVGRAGWDLWMIANGRRRNLRVIDLSGEVLVVHQNHDFSHRKTAFTGYPDDEEAMRNVGYLPEGDKQDHTLYACDHRFEDGVIFRNYARGDWRRFLTIELRLHNESPVVALIGKVFYRLGLIY